MRSKEEQAEIVKRALSMSAEAEPPETHKQHKEQPEFDPVVPVDAWLPIFHEWRCSLIPDAPDYIFLREHNPELYHELKALERKTDALQDAKLSEVMNLLTEWRQLVLKACFEQREREKAQ
jgi:hypothetical protein